MSPEDAAELKAWRDSLEERMNNLEKGHRRLSDKIQENTDVTKGIDTKVDNIDANLGWLVQMLQEGRGAFKLFSRLMFCIRWVGKKLLWPLILVIGGCYAAFHGGEVPGWIDKLIHFWK